jgi:hypothetical protein
MKALFLRKLLYVFTVEKPMQNCPHVQNVTVWGIAREIVKSRTGKVEQAADTNTYANPLLALV